MNGPAVRRRGQHDYTIRVHPGDAADGLQHVRLDYAEPHESGRSRRVYFIYRILRQRVLLGEHRLLLGEPDERYL